MPCFQCTDDVTLRFIHPWQDANRFDKIFTLTMLSKYYYTHYNRSASDWSRTEICGPTPYTKGLLFCPFTVGDQAARCRQEAKWTKDQGDKIQVVKNCINLSPRQPCQNIPESNSQSTILVFSLNMQNSTCHCNSQSVFSPTVSYPCTASQKYRSSVVNIALSKLHIYFTVIRPIWFYSTVQIVIFRDRDNHFVNEQQEINMEIVKCTCSYKLKATIYMRGHIRASWLCTFCQNIIIWSCNHDHLLLSFSSYNLETINTFHMDVMDITRHGNRHELDW